eukprot:gene39666-52321_t
MSAWASSGHQPPADRADMPNIQWRRLVILLSPVSCCIKQPAKPATAPAARRPPPGLRLRPAGAAVRAARRGA